MSSGFGPVLSSARARLSFLMPQTTSPAAVMSNCVWPIMRQNMVSSLAEADDGEAVAAYVDGGHLLRDRDIGGLGPVEQRGEIARGLSLELIGCQIFRVFGKHQSGRIERRLHGGVHRTGAAVVYRSAECPDQRDEAEGQDRRNAGLSVPEKSAKQHGRRLRAGNPDDRFPRPCRAATCSFVIETAQISAKFASNCP